MVAKSRENYPDRIRRIKYYDAEKDIRLLFLTNDFELEALEIASIYKSRWQIEVFFQVNQAKPPDKDALGTFTERRKDTMMDSDKHLSDCGLLETAHKMALFRLRNNPSFGYIDIYQNTCKRAFYQKVNSNQNFKEQLNLFNDKEL